MKDFFRQLFPSNSFDFDRYDQKVIIFGWTRTGSSNLAKIFESTENIKVTHEPFHPSKGFTPNSIDDLKVHLKTTLWPTCNAIKHVNGLNNHQNKYLLLHPDHKIIFLWRSNSLQRIFSEFLARQTKNYGSLENNREIRLKQEKMEFKPFDINKMNKSIKKYKKEVQYYKTAMDKAGKPYIEVKFEDLFSDQPLENKIKKLMPILEFVGIQNTSDEFIESIKWRLDTKMKQSSDMIYKSVPNFDEIQEKLGSPANGWLVK